MKKRNIYIIGALATIGLCALTFSILKKCEKCQDYSLD